jgi:flagellar basal-body rod modification protein FlgD
MSPSLFPTTTNNQSPPASSAPVSATSKPDPLANESTFLTLLVSQLKNQDPLSPVDSNQFVSQLTEYSQLEQLIGIKANTTPLAPAATTNPITGA